MVDSSLATILTGAGACGVFCLLFIFGIIYPKNVVTDLKEERNAEKARADAERVRADAERSRADAAVAAAQATSGIMTALREGITMNQQRQALPDESASPGSSARERRQR